jgi:type IV fimbrial biogenesis protein FimT
MKKYNGFTLIELMMTLAVATILMTVAVPSFRTIIQNNRLTTEINEYLTSISIARSEAIKRADRVTMCISSDGAACITTGDWSQGWIIFIDSDNDAVVDGGEEILRVHGALSTGTTLDGSANLDDYISYKSDGSSQTTASAVQSGTVILCDSRGSGNGKGIELNATGRARTITGANVTTCTP